MKTVLKAIGYFFAALFFLASILLISKPGQLDSGLVGMGLSIAILYFIRKPHLKKVELPKFEKAHTSSRETVSTITTLKNKAKTEKEKTQQLLKIFNPEKILTSSVAVDIEHRLLGLKTFRKYNRVYEIDNIFEYEIVEDGTTLSKGGLGLAAVGGLTFGAAGAIVGAVSGAKKTKTTITKLQIKLTTRTLDNPIIYIDLIIGPTAKPSSYYEHALKDADHIIGALDILLKAEKELPHTYKTVEDELLELKNLHDKQLITDNEFEMKKKQILKL